MSKTIKVRPVDRPDAPVPDLVLLDDQDERHPEGYVQLRLNSKPIEVGDTPRVRELIASGVLAIVEPRPAAAPQAKE